MAFRGQFDDAARAYSAGGRPDLAVKLFTDMRRFKQAEQWASGDEQKRGLLELRAGWAEKEEDKGEAIELFLQLGEVEKALIAMKEIGWARRVLDTARALDVVGQRETIELAASILLEMNDSNGAAELYELNKDIKSVVEIKLASKDWEYLLALSDREPFHRETILMPYAQYLIENDRFIEARSVYLRAGHPEAATSVLAQLAQVAVTIERFSDASFYNHLLGQVAEESTLALTDSGLIERAYSAADEFQSKAELYNLYSVVDNVVKDPFSILSAESVFHASRILAAKLWSAKDIPPGIKLGYVLFVLANYGMKLECYKTARMAMERLKDLWLPKKLNARFVELYVQNRTCPFQDPQELSDFCHACSSFNSLVNTRTGFSCQSCASALKYCNVSFEHLPLVEFFLAPTITNDEALTLITMEPMVKGSKNSSEVEVQEGVVRFDRPKTAAPSGSNEQFFADFQRKGAIVVDREVLRNLNEEEVVILRLGNGRQWRFFRNMLADVVPVTACCSCCRLFNSDDYFASLLELSSCPFCREPVAVEANV
ncbi:hypothetical protein RvY_13448 [Ramazzottius varieornatus]|uniref:Intraflagellar transport protein 122 homolog TPR domain-containing protein n=1 Tax=Ramazzottius varieornatus TaxID=947166 RepID=A0A1D1VMX4_RAMVA|nr:hypothetical protein RvY_13448 [Ramazzottius varieornatus]